MEEKTQRSMKSRVVLVPCPFQGHINPMLHLGMFLHLNGFSVTVAHARFNSPNPSNHPEFKFQAIPDNLLDDVVPSRNLIKLLTLISMNCQAPFREWLVRTVEEEEQDGCNEKIVCVIYDEVMYFVEAAANQAKLPSIILRTTNAATAISRVALIGLKVEGHNLPFPDPASRDPVPELHPLRYKDLPISMNGVTEEYLNLISNMYDIRASSAIVWNTMDWLDQTSLKQLQRQWHIPIFPIGPLQKITPTSNGSLHKQDTSCLQWLNKQANNSVIYVSLGSIASMDEKELVEMAWGLVNSKQPFLWVVRSQNDSEPIELLLPEGFVEAVGGNGRVVKWAPQKEVLAHHAVGGFWSHCGWNSVLESMCEGVPMICRPCFGDQWVNSRYISYVWRIGLELENTFERGEIAKTIRRLMVDKEGEDMRQRAEDLKEEVELCIREGGSSYNSCNELVEFINSFKMKQTSI